MIITWIAYINSVRTNIKGYLAQVDFEPIGKIWNFCSKLYNWYMITVAIEMTNMFCCLLI